MIFLSYLTEAIAQILNIVVQVMIIILVIRAIVSWFVRNPYENPIVEMLYRITEPILFPIRRFLFRYMPNMMIDFSPMIAILILIFVRQFVVRSLLELSRRI
ncbi:MAG: YggT family protein [Candidatus Bipolaricaulia bacterium]